MRSTDTRIARLTTVFCITSLLSIFLRPAQAAQRAERQPQGGLNPRVTVGEFPPDFELPRLTFKTDANGKSNGVISEDETIKLSSFRSKKPVCMIMSSYT